MALSKRRKVSAVQKVEEESNASVEEESNASVEEESNASVEEESNASAEEESDALVDEESTASAEEESDASLEIDSDDDSVIEETEETSPKKPRHGNGEHEDGDGDDEEETDDKCLGNAGWADAISKVLRTNKPKKKKTLVLSRAKKLNETSPKDEPEKLTYEVDGEVKEEVKVTEGEEDVKPDVKPILSMAELREQKKKRKMWESISRSKPDVLAKEREKALSKIATRGVIQLFNAVRKQQKDIEGELEDAGPSERKRDKVLKNVDKNSFLDILMGPSKSVHIGRKTESEAKKEEEDSKAPLWSVLRDDFMMGDGKLKDWDREAGNDDEESGEEESMGEDSDGSS